MTIEDGVPVKRSANIVVLTSSGAVVKTRNSLQPGQNIVLIIRDAERDLFDIFDINGSAMSSKTTVKTQGEVTEIRKLNDNEDGFSLKIRFIGNIKVSSDSDNG